MIKEKDKIDVRFCMCFPDVYEIGMSHLGIQILYDMFNRREDTWCERVYSPWPDLDAEMRKHAIPLFALESQDPIKDFDFLGITLQYEMCYTNILQVLDLSGIPLRTKDRKKGDTLVIIDDADMRLNVSNIPGLYVPELYEVTYHEDGTIASFGPKFDGVPATVTKTVVMDHSKVTYPEKPVVSFMKLTQD